MAADGIIVPPLVAVADEDSKKAVTTTSSSSSESGRDNNNNADNDPVYGSTDDHIFSDQATADYWRKVYEQSHYENRHRFDPSYKWTADEEKKLVRRVGVQPLTASTKYTRRKKTVLTGSAH